MFTTQHFQNYNRDRFVLSHPTPHTGELFDYFEPHL